MKLFYTGPVINTEMLVMMLEKHGIAATQAFVDPGAPDAAEKPGRRRSTQPLIIIARAEKQEDALAGLERWKASHSDVAGLLEPADVLVDSMRGRSSTWTRIRINLRHVPVEQRPAQETVEPDYDPWARYRGQWEKLSVRKKSV